MPLSTLAGWAATSVVMVPDGRATQGTFPVGTAYLESVLSARVNGANSRTIIRALRLYIIRACAAHARTASARIVGLGSKHGEGIRTNIASLHLISLRPHWLVEEDCCASL